MENQTWSDRVPRRFVIPAAGLAVFLVGSMLYWSGSRTFYTLLRLWGVHPPIGIPFLDLRYIFAAIECWGKGANVYLFDPCDPLGRLFGYSPVWLRMPFLSPQRWTTVSGILIDTLFLVSLTAFPPPRRLGDGLILLLATLSPPVVFALQRANVDLIIFILCLGAGALWQRLLWRRAISYAVIVVVGLLKFYPLILLVLAIRERIRVAVIVFAAAGFILVVFALYFHTELIEMSSNIPVGGYFTGGYFAVDMFGARNFPNGVSSALGIGPSDWIGVLPWGVLGALFARPAYKIMMWAKLRRDIMNLPSLERSLLLFGATIISGCFFAGQNAGYRGIFLLWTLPGLLALWRRTDDERVRSFVRLLSVLVLLLMWQGVLTWNGAFLETIKRWLGPGVGSATWSGLWAARELTWWAVVAMLAGVFLCFALESHVALWLRGRFNVPPVGTAG